MLIYQSQGHREEHFLTLFSTEIFFIWKVNTNLTNDEFIANDEFVKFEALDTEYWTGLDTEVNGDILNNGRW